MFERINTLLLSARNTVGRYLARSPLRGLMPAYTPDQIAQAKADHDYFQGKLAGLHHTTALMALLPGAITGSHEGEDSFNDSLPGDKRNGVYEAKGRSQWHQSRRALILQNTSIDVWNATPDQQREAMYREITESWSWYKHIWEQLMAATTVEEAVTVLVVKYEQSGSQARDIARRTEEANYWIAYSQANWTQAV